MQKLFETVSFHVIKPCNMSCKFCYATYNNFKVQKQLTIDDAKIIMEKIIKHGVKKITFAGGEPMLWKPLDETIRLAKAMGATTSIITNGSLITEDWLIKMQGKLDWIGISIDSLYIGTNTKIGRHTKDKIAGYFDYKSKIDLIKKYGYKLKINTVVNKYNFEEDFNAFIKYTAPDRWKVFQAMKVQGQNDATFEEVRVSDDEYDLFIDKHRHNHCIVPENNADMTQSYLLIDPKGRFYENNGVDNNKHSDSLITHSVDHCISQITLNRETFLARGGLYAW